MTREFFNRQFAVLVMAYLPAQKLPDQTQDVYWTMLQGIPADKFSAGVKKCLAELKWFPTIHELGESSLPAKLKTIKRPARFFSYAQNWDEQVQEMQGIKPERIDGSIRKLLEEF